MRISSTPLEACWTLCGHGRISEALTAGSLVAERARSAGDNVTLAGASCLCAWFSLQLGAFEAGLRHAGLGREAAVAAGNIDWECQTLAVKAWLLHEVGLVDEAATQAQDCVARARRDGVDDETASWAFNVSAVICWTTKQLALAEAHVSTAVSLARGLSDAMLLRWWLINLGGIHVEKGYLALAEGDTDAARLAIEAGIGINAEAVHMSEVAGDEWTLKLGLCNAVEYHLALDEPSKAEEMLDRSEAILAPGARSLTHHTYNKAQVLARTGRLGDARLFCLDALAMAERDKDADGRYHAYRYLSEIHERMGRFEEALAFYKQFHEVQSRLTEERVRLRVRLAEVHYETEGLKRAVDAVSLLAEEATRSSLIDPLTGVGNRRALDEALARLRGDGGPTCIAVLDVDHFKRVNDTFGHLAGDEVLRRLGSMLNSILAPGDEAVRLGGEEFALLLRNVQGAAAASVCERLRERIATNDWKGVHPDLSVTVSIGVAASTQASDPLEVLAMADERLYLAKACGRNRVIDGSDCISAGGVVGSVASRACQS